MNLKLLLLMGILSSGLFVLAWQKVSPPEVFTASQAEAGRAAYERTCAKCHVSDLRGRPGRGRDGRGPLGEQSELPPISSLSPGYQQFIGKRGFVPPLAGGIHQPLGGQNRRRSRRPFRRNRYGPVLPVRGRERRYHHQYHRVRAAGKRGQGGGPAINQNHRGQRQGDGETLDEFPARHDGYGWQVPTMEAEQQPPHQGGGPEG